MAYDGSLKFDTKINTDGFDEGNSSLKTAMEKLASVIEKLSRNMEQAFSRADKAALKFGDQANHSAKQVDEITDSAKTAEKELRELKKQMESVSVTGITDGTGPNDKVEVPRVIESDGSMKDYGDSVQKYIDEYMQDMKNASESTNEFKNEIGKLETQIKELEGNGLYFGDQEYDEAYLKLEKVKQALRDYKKEMLSPTPDADVFPADTLQGKVESLKRKMELLTQEGKTFGDAAYDNVYQKLNRAQAALSEYKKNLSSPIEIPVEFDKNSFEGQKRRLAEELAELEKRGVSLGSPEYDRVFKNLQKVINAENQYKKSLTGVDKNQNKVSKSAQRMGSHLKKAGNASGKAGKKMTIFSMLGRSVLFSMVFRGISMVTKAFTEGLGNLSQYSDETNKSMSTLMSGMTKLRNSFSAAFAPIVNAAAPALKTLIDLMSQGATWAAQFISALTGKSAYIKAKDVQEDYAESIKETGKEADKAKKSVAAFDDLIQMSPTEAESTYEPPKPEEMFEIVEVETEMITFASAVKDIFSVLFDPIKQSWDMHGAAAIEAAKLAFGSIKTLAQDVGASFMQVWNTEGYGQKITSDLLITFQNMALTVKNLVDRFDDAWNSGDVGTSVLRHLGDIILEITGFFRDASESIKNWAATLDFGPLLKAVDGALVAIRPLVSKIGDLLLWLLNNVLLPITKWALETAIPKAIDLFSGALKFLGSVLDTLQPLAMWLWETFLQPLGKWAGEIFIEALDIITGLLIKFSDWIDDHQSAIEFITASVLGFFAAWTAAEFVGKVKMMMDVLSDTGGFIGILKRLISNLDTTRLKYLGVYAAIGVVLGAIYEIYKNWGKMTVSEKIISSILAAAAAVATLAVAVHAVKGAWAIAAIAGALAAGVAAATIAVNAGKRSTSALSYSSPGGYAPSMASYTGTYTPPRLATGTVVPPRAGEFAAILGDNNREPEIVSPVSSMKQAFKEAIQEMGGLEGNRPIKGDVYLERQKLGKIVYELNREETQRVGVRMVTEG